ncbi:hypothetical protein [Streptomyces jeddahensis]|uniref:Integral membrane protein n=1 Tax=Streptomyces jeddahensis TaxID=1716141 RepID=A0A177HIX3_9ACTN|nr:hypothetical protein [Streptomyces jeddahensis]OAH10579.1 hypothetical protein STSP_61070 [Streptomyces jeddahensis]
METGDAELKKELDATLRARRELGEDYDSALVESFLDKVDQHLDAVVDRRVRRHLAEQQMVAARGTRSPGSGDSWGDRFGFGLISLILAVPLSAIAAGTADFPGLLVAWTGIVAINTAQALRTRPGFGSRREKPSDWEE